MQYILTQKEYDDLQNSARMYEDNKHRILTQKEVIKLAQIIPVKGYFVRGEPLIPWGCVIDPPDNYTDSDGVQIFHYTSGYCDFCPVKKFCLSDNKRFSK